MEQCGRYNAVKREKAGEKLARYTFFLDESETYEQGNPANKYFVLGGVIIKSKDYSGIENALRAAKQAVWDNEPGCENYILHEKEVSFASKYYNRTKLDQVAPCNKVFAQKGKTQELYKELSKILVSSHIVTMGVCLAKEALRTAYCGEEFMNNRFSIAIQALVENYCRFLLNRQSSGDICYEFVGEKENAIMQQRLYELKALGTLYYAPRTLQNTIRNVNFVAKKENEAGLQLADFVPNALGRHIAGEKAKNQDFAKNVRSKLYDGGMEDGREKFGFKVLR